VETAQRADGNMVLVEAATCTGMGDAMGSQWLNCKLFSSRRTWHELATKRAAAATRAPQIQIGDIKVIRKVAQTGHENPRSFGETGHGSRIFSPQKSDNLGQNTRPTLRSSS
jgi:hypothetical protein